MLMSQKKMATRGDQNKDKMTETIETSAQRESMEGIEQLPNVIANQEEEGGSIFKTTEPIKTSNVQKLTFRQFTKISHNKPEIYEALSVTGKLQLLNALYI